MNLDLGQLATWGGFLTGLGALIAVLLKARSDARADRINARAADSTAASSKQDLDERIAAAGRARVADIVTDNETLRADVAALAGGFAALRRMVERSPGHADPTPEEAAAIDAASAVLHR